MRFLGIDPGTQNCAFSIIDLQGKSYNILATGLIKNTLKDMTKDNLLNDISGFISEISKIITKYKIKHVIAERFQSRGLKGSTIEKVSYMLGCIGTLMSEVFGGDLLLITAAQWKNQYNKYLELETTYKEVASTKHQIDATCIALYGIAYTFKFPYFVFLKRNEGITKLYSQLESKNTEYFKPRRIKIEMPISRSIRSGRIVPTQRMLDVVSKSKKKLRSS